MCCSLFMGNIDVPTQNNQPLKMPMGTYEFGANLVSNKVCCCSMEVAHPYAQRSIGCYVLLLSSHLFWRAILKREASLAGQHDDWPRHDGWKDERQGQVSTSSTL